MKKLHFGISVLLIFALSITSCSKHKAEKQKKEDEKIIQQYIADHSLNATGTGTGLYYVITSQGTGETPDINSTVTVAYKGYLTDGTVFDESGSAGATFALSQVIEGWQQGIPFYKKGGKGILLIPSALGYGSSSPGKIPKNSVLIFDIELINVQ